MFTTRISSICAALTAAALFASSAAYAAVTHPADLSGLTYTSPGTLVDSFHSNDLADFGDLTVLNHVSSVLGVGLVQIGTSAQSVCNAGGYVLCGGGNPAYNGPAANIFVVQYGTSDLLAFLYSDDMTHFGVSGIPSLSLGFVRAYCSLAECGYEVSETPLPGAVWLFGTVMAGAGGFGAWRRRKAKIA